MQRGGDYPPPPGCPEWMGLEIAGTIVKVGKTAAERSNRKPGDRVCALLGGGGYAQYVNVRYDMLMPVPRELHDGRSCSDTGSLCHVVSESVHGREHPIR